MVYTKLENISFEINLELSGIVDGKYQNIKREGELYISGNEIVVGTGKKWLHMNIGDIKNIDYDDMSGKLAIKFNNFNLMLFSHTNYLKALKQYLYPKTGGEKVISNTNLIYEVLRDYSRGQTDINWISKRLKLTPRETREIIAKAYNHKFVDNFGITKKGREYLNMEIHNRRKTA